jgi:hypothetical protein
MDSQRRLYALAGALAVETAELLKSVHRAVGAPGDASEIPPRRRGLLAAAARSYGAAAACSGLTARLLLVERDAAAQRLGDLPPPHLAEVGITFLEDKPQAAWRALVRACAAALAELGDARAAWVAAADEMGDPVVSTLETMMRYVDDVAGVLEVSEPPAHSA